MSKNMFTNQPQPNHQANRAAKIISEQPEPIQLRKLQTLTEIAGNKSSLIVFPLVIIKMTWSTSGVTDPR